jgi:hypothetical protein
MALAGPYVIFSDELTVCRMSTPQAGFMAMCLKTALWNNCPT